MRECVMMVCVLRTYVSILFDSSTRFISDRGDYCDYFENVNFQRNKSLK